MKKIIPLLMVIVFYSCSTNWEFWSVDEFNIVEGSLQNNEQVAVLYYSRGPSDDKVEEGYYRHAVVVSKSSMDTFNVLTFPNPELNSFDATNNLFTYKDHPDVNEILSQVEGMSDNIKNSLEAIEPKNISWSSYTKVARYPKFDFIAKNDYKTVIGALSRK